MPRFEKKYFGQQPGYWGSSGGFGFGSDKFIILDDCSDTNPFVGVFLFPLCSHHLSTSAD